MEKNSKLINDFRTNMINQTNMMKQDLEYSISTEKALAWSIIYSIFLFWCVVFLIVFSFIGWI